MHTPMVCINTIHATTTAPEPENDRVSIKAISGENNLEIASLTREFSITLEGLHTVSALKLHFALTDNTGTRLIGETSGTFVIELSKHDGSLAQNRLNLSNFGLTCLPATGKYRIYPVASTSNSPEQFVRDEAGNEVFTTLGIEYPIYRRKLFDTNYMDATTPI